MTRKQSLTSRHRKKIHSQSQRLKIRVIIISTFVISLLIISVVTLQKLTPTKVECITGEHTYCTEAIGNEFKSLKNVPWWQWPRAFKTTKEQVQNKYSQIIRVSWQPTLLAGAEITVNSADKLFTFVDQQDNWVMLSNGEVIAAAQETYPVLSFNSSFHWQNLNEEERENIGLLFQKLKGINPVVKLITINELNNVLVTLENQTQFLMRADQEKDIIQQVNTLQAFLRSSTMKQDYQIIDLRFEDQIIVRE